MIIVLPRSASPDSPHSTCEDRSPDLHATGGDEPAGLRLRQAGILAVVDADSHAALRQWLITQPLYAAFSWELEGHATSSTLVPALS